MEVEFIMFLAGVLGYIGLTFKWGEISYWFFLIVNAITAGIMYTEDRHWAMCTFIVYCIFCIINIYKESRDSAVSSNYENYNHRTDVIINADRNSIPEEYRDRFSKY